VTVSRSLALALVLASTSARADSMELVTRSGYEDASQAELDAAYHHLLERPHQRYLLPAAELLTAVVGGFTWYWIDRSRQVADWDFPSIKQRFTGAAWKYDTNPFPINWAWHAYDGAQYHLFARGNDLSFLESIVYGVGTSVAWEFTVEFRESVSINDVILTSAAGTVIGEYLHWLGRYFESRPDKRWWQPIPAWLLTTSREGHNAIFGYDRLRKGTTPDHLGFSSDIWHRFELSAGLAYARATGDISETRDGSARPSNLRLVAAGDLGAFPGYLTASSLDRNFSNAQVSSARLRLEGNGDDAFALDFGVDSFLVGHHWQRFKDGRGNASTIGLDLAYRYRRELFGPYVMRLAQTHLPGFAFDHHLKVGDLWLRGRVRANYDFVGAHALAYRTWHQEQVAAGRDPDNQDEFLETGVVRKHKFYFGWGPSTRLDVMASMPNVSAGASLGLAKYHAARGYDRLQDDLTDDLKMGDTIVDWDAWLRVGSPLKRTFVEARIEQNRRENYVEDVTEKTKLTSFLLMFGTEQ
jgi:hypothetical protein